MARSWHGVYLRLGQGQPPLENYVWPSDPDELQKYLDRCSPSLTALQMNHASLTHIEGVRFPANLIKIDLFGNQIQNLNRVQFPPNLTHLNLSSNHITNLNGVQFPPNLTELYLGGNGINSLQGANFPSTLTTLELDHNNIESLQGIQFPSTLTSLNLGWNNIHNLDRIQFPPKLIELWLNDNRLIHMSGVQFPPGLTKLDLSNSEERGDERMGYGYNQLKSFNEVKFPPSLIELNLQRNRLETLGRIIEPTPNVLHLIELQFPKIVEEYRKTLTRQSQQTEQATLKEVSDFNQQSMQNQLRGITSFLREGMESRAQQHAEQLEREGKERGKPLIYIRLIANGMRYPVPLNTTESVQSVIDYINEHYYISSLVSNCGAIHLYKSDRRGRLDNIRVLADYNIQNGETLNAQCRIMQYVQSGGNQTTKRLQIRKNINKNKKSKKHWSLKYKKSINCKRPRGFSQRQYCKYGRKK